MRTRSDMGASSGQTSMIDVVFLLLVFFLVVSVPEHRIAVSDVSQARGGGQEDVTRPIPIEVLADAYVIDGRRVDREGLGRMLEDIAPYMGTATLLFVCRDDAPHGQLMTGLDLCHQHGITQLSIGRGS